MKIVGNYSGGTKDFIYFVEIRFNENRLQKKSPLYVFCYYEKSDGYIVANKMICNELSSLLTETIGNCIFWQ